MNYEARMLGKPAVGVLYSSVNMEPLEIDCAVLAWARSEGWKQPDPKITVHTFDITLTNDLLEQVEDAEEYLNQKYGDNPIESFNKYFFFQHNKETGGEDFCFGVPRHKYVNWNGQFIEARFTDHPSVVR